MTRLVVSAAFAVAAVSLMWALDELARVLERCAANERGADA